MHSTCGVTVVCTASVRHTGNASHLVPFPFSPTTRPPTPGCSFLLTRISGCCLHHTRGHRQDKAHSSQCRTLTAWCVAEHERLGIGDGKAPRIQRLSWPVWRVGSSIKDNCAVAGEPRTRSLAFNAPLLQTNLVCQVDLAPTRHEQACATHAKLVYQKSVLFNFEATLIAHPQIH